MSLFASVANFSDDLETIRDALLLEWGLLSPGHKDFFDRALEHSCLLGRHVVVVLGLGVDAVMRVVKGLKSLMSVVVVSDRGRVECLEA